MIGAILLGLLAGTIGRMLVPDMWSGLSGPKSWLFSLGLGLGGALQHARSGRGWVRTSDLSRVRRALSH